MDLFSNSESVKSEPLASRMRPRTLDEYVGQEHILGKGRLLRRAIQKDQLSSVIFYGPPGTGKTTLARVIANTTKSYFATLNAVLAGVKELEAEINQAKERKDLYGIRTILFVDEVHRWNKRQQDALLPWVENGTVILIGATTENPYFEVNAALVSRSRIFQLKKLTDKDLFDIAEATIKDESRGYGKYDVCFEEGALEHLVKVSNGDARSLLNAMELAIETTGNFPPKEGAKIFITKETAEESIQKKAVLYDKEGDYHFDVISAFIKSLRGSDVDAALYWLAKMVNAGEDSRFIFRRMMILASEDVGMADPFALTFVTSCAEAFDRIGLPEGRFHLAHAAIYLATTKKSNTTLGFFDALSDVENERDDDVPNHLKDPSRDKEGFNHGEGYLYPHSYKDHWVAQQYLPSSLLGKIYYKPTGIGYEGEIRDSVVFRRQAQLESISADESEEVLTWSPGDKKRNLFLERAMAGRSAELKSSTETLFSAVKIKRHDNALILNASSGLMLYPVMKMNPEGLTVCHVRKNDERDVISHFCSELEELTRPEILVSPKTENVFSMLEEGLKFSLIASRNILSRLKDGENILKEIKKRLETDGIFLLMQALPSQSSRLSDFIDEPQLKKEILKAEEKIYSSSELTCWDEKDLENLVSAYFPSSEYMKKENTEKRKLTEAMLSSWWDKSYSRYLSEDIRESYIRSLSEKLVDYKTITLLVRSNLNKQSKETDDAWLKVLAKTK
ncbi:MAG TPA: AAA family ATPase [Candidatus Ornithospirochaeta avicola]|uniref:Replication-associated recombination protein A n=1 Tax=Candidatus Ornithospirochaeta avicola TaxID=2840896 RepID=A0A9D1TMY5_9SPIO|nr:AAA family ATPase [Candidatus Ornithospirochaeta avicola]